MKKKQTKRKKQYNPNRVKIMSHEADVDSAYFLRGNVLEGTVIGGTDTSIGFGQRTMARKNKYNGFVLIFHEDQDGNEALYKHRFDWDEYLDVDELARRQNMLLTQQIRVCEAKGIDKISSGVIFTPSKTIDLEQMLPEILTFFRSNGCYDRLVVKMMDDKHQEMIEKFPLKSMTDEEYEKNLLETHRETTFFYGGTMFPQIMTTGVNITPELGWKLLSETTSWSISYWFNFRKHTGQPYNDYTHLTVNTEKGMVKVMEKLMEYYDKDMRHYQIHSAEPISFTYMLMPTVLTEPEAFEEVACDIFDKHKRYDRLAVKLASSNKNPDYFKVAGKRELF